MNVSLPDELAAFVKKKVGTGRYASYSEVVREALRLMERLDQQDVEDRVYLRRARQKGIDGMRAEELGADALKPEGHASLAALSVCYQLFCDPTRRS